jgi:hypothetical protein
MRLKKFLVIDESIQPINICTEAQAKRSQFAQGPKHALKKAALNGPSGSGNAGEAPEGGIGVSSSGGVAAGGSACAERGIVESEEEPPRRP